MQPQVALLIVSSSLENKKALRRILEDLPVNVFTVSTLEQAREVFFHRRIAVIFCEENVSDGPYSKLLAFVRAQHESTQFIVMLRTGEWKEYLEAMHSGAFGVLYCPLQPTDVELALIHAMRENPIVREGQDFSAVSA